MSTMQRLKDRVCVVTGSSSGIGKAIAMAFLREGAIVEGVDVSEGDPKCVSNNNIADVSDIYQVNSVIAEIINRHGKIDGLVNCAGICPSGSVTSTDEKTWDRVFEINVKGCYLMSRAVVPYMEMQSSGTIVHVASNYALVGGRNAAAYCASKGAVVSLTRAMALDHAFKGIRVNCICPGTIETPLVREPMKFMSSDQIEEITKSRHYRHPLGRIGRPEEVAPGAVYLISDDASFVTGTILSIDGGYVAQ
jgi:NAD(P)-dependent dehydrogenase (short-subunit alcohol dehydrogenase family)